MTYRDPPKITARQAARIEARRAEDQLLLMGQHLARAKREVTIAKDRLRIMEQRLDRVEKDVREARAWVEKATAAPDYETTAERARRWQRETDERGWRREETA